MLKKMKVMRKSIVVFLAVLLSAGFMQAQVKIGHNEAPRGGVILDLSNESGGYKGGLLLPRINIDDLGKIPQSFSNGPVTRQDTLDLAGLVIWNTRQGFEGVYMWDGAGWKRLEGTDVVYPDCSGGGPKINSISDLPSYAQLDEEFDVTCDATITGSATYNWNIPSELEAVSDNGAKTIRLKAKNTGEHGGNISCTVTDACSTASRSKQWAMTVCNDIDIMTVTGASGFVYHYRCYPDPDAGCWIRENSREGTPTVYNYPGHEPGERGYYYDLAAVSDLTNKVCPDGWTLPSDAQAAAMFHFIQGNNSCTNKFRGEVGGSLSDPSTPDLLWHDGSWSYQDAAAGFWSDNLKGLIFGSYGCSLQNVPFAYPVRCVKAAP
jgi:uncharacterized protein (TIGR02145 family)